MKLRIAGIVTDSIVDGPGIRVAIFAQGCFHACPGCHNPHTHDANGGTEMIVDEIMTEIGQARYIQGVTFTGGEPFLQAKGFAELARRVKAADLHLVVYSGYTFEGLIEMGRKEPEIIQILSMADWLVDGPYKAEQRDLTLPFRGSRNQRILLSAQSLASGQAIQAIK
ncbi:anaerobic ribonucleoside-triphosphate reductase activating protein [Heliobacterium chlorum]|uniref:Anaerobic ribonucleoside-triphosphate reductase-activating protein n=1 Tax=Heliobacterium chlorum TaxID=2698 RepID=A0ABR7SXK8_HELCL|nr:anaerobic ribonucleoside-triphosphate reductase activating protein [Heliobacterium chlorum]MBC9783273.1 anaerobic ribonucleoside-triphosphate reductase activating protein [Heliobacterium chlorum]